MRISSRSLEASATTTPKGSARNDPPQNSQAGARCGVAVDVTVLVADAIHHSDINAVGDGMPALHGAPGIVLRRAELLLLRRMPADRGRIKQYLCALERRQSRALGIPLVPADQRADPACLRVEGAEAEIARGEVELLVIKRIVGDMHLAVDAFD